MRWSLLALCLVGCEGLGHPVVSKIERNDGYGSQCAGLSSDDCSTPFTPRVPFSAPTPVTPSCATQPCSSTLTTSSRGLVASHQTITLHADTPTTVELHDVKLDDVAIDLRGPVSLRLDGQLTKLSIVGEGEVTVSDSSVDALAVALPGGSLRIERSTVSNSQLAVQELNLETVKLTDLQVSAKRMVGIELTGARMQLDVSDLSLSKLEVAMLELHRCDSALVVSALLGKVKLAACSELLRMHSSSITNGVVQGAIESVGSSWGDTRFGAGGAATTISLNGGALSRSLLCADVQHLSVTSATSVACDDCRELPNPELRLCLDAKPMDLADAGAGFHLVGNPACPLFDDGLPLCQ